LNFAGIFLEVSLIGDRAVSPKPSGDWAKIIKSLKVCWVGVASLGLITLHPCWALGCSGGRVSDGLFGGPRCFLVFRCVLDSCTVFSANDDDWDDADLALVMKLPSGVISNSFYRAAFEK
jgi:hypothetical protein